MGNVLRLYSLLNISDKTSKQLGAVKVDQQRAGTSKSTGTNLGPGKVEE